MHRQSVRRKQISFVQSAQDHRHQFCLSVRSRFLENRLEIGACGLVLNTERIRAGSKRLSCNEADDKARLCRRQIKPTLEKYRLRHNQPPLMLRAWGTADCNAA